jgi:hypothetical protein
MIRPIGKCPHCETIVAVDSINAKLVFNPDSRRPVCGHVAYIDGHVTYWDEERKVVNCSAALAYESAEASKVSDEFDLREYMAKLRRKDNVHPNAPYSTSEHRLDCQEEGLANKKMRDCIDVEAWLVFSDNANLFFHACEDDWNSRQTA